MEVIQIAIRLPADMLRQVDEVARSGKVRPRWGGKPNRSEIIRLAVKDYLVVDRYLAAQGHDTT